MKACKHYNLDNGLKVHLQETPTETFAGKLNINFGSGREKEGEEGLVHFLEHSICMGGTKKFDPVMVNSIINSFGYFNAVTSINKVIFDTISLDEDIELFLDFVSESAFYPKFNSLKVEEERKRIFREIATERSGLSFKDSKKYKEALYGNTAHAKITLGDEKIVKNATIGDLANLHKKGFFSNNADLIIVGNLPANIDFLIKKYFDDVKTGKIEPFEFPNVEGPNRPILIHSPAPYLINKEQPLESNSGIQIGIAANPYALWEKYAGYMMSRILNQRLFDAVSTATGNAYQFGCSYDFNENKNVIVITGNIGTGNQFKAIDIVFNEFNKLKKDYVRDSEIEREKRKYNFNIKSTYESNQGWRNAIEFEMEHKCTIKEHADKMLSVTPKEIIDTANNSLPTKSEGKYVLLLQDPSLSL